MQLMESKSEFMKDTQILSAFLPPGPLSDLPKEPQPSTPLVFDACQLGVVLRTVLFVEVVVGVGVVYTTATWIDWVLELSMLTGGALPATLAWLLVACGAKRMLARLPAALQYGVAVGLGGLAGLYACGILHMIGLLPYAPWVASACTGALLSSLVVAALVLRAKGRTPADTSARLAELQSRIRPHFLFNTLNSAIALVRAEPAKAETLLEDLSDLFRHALQDMDKPVTLAEEIHLAQRYLAIEQVRFGERLRVEWALDPQAQAARLPPLLLQPLVENAVRHGVEPSPTGAEIRISTQRRGSTVVIKVSNTVPAGTGQAGHGLALANVRDRLNLMHDVQSDFRSVLKNGVYQVRMEVPL
jgi:two-component system, LytTR family, sensor histidine kinase AlgZ